MKRLLFPFTAVLGQEKIKNALIWNVINPKIGGVLISGEKGTAKSTLVRGLSDVCGKNIVELPLNITEDRLLGAINFENAIKTGKKELEPGILAKAHNNILYVDEINLLSDNIVKALVDVASEGICTVERESISQKYPSDFILIGSMNPEEGGLRPQLIDRFGLFVEVVSENNAEIRAEIIEKRLEFEQDPTAYIDKYNNEQEFLKKKITKAQKRLNEIEVSKEAILLASQLSKDAFCQGHRAEIIIIETAKAIAAEKGLYKVEHDHVIEASKYALPHRMRQIPPQLQNNQDNDNNEEEHDNSSKENNETMQDNKEQNTEIENSPNEHKTNENNETEKNKEENSFDNSENKSPATSESQYSDNKNEKLDSAGDIFTVSKWLDFKSHDRVNKGSGRRSLVKTNSSMGRYVASRPFAKEISSADLAFDATLRAAAPFQNSRNKNGMAISIQKSDIRVKQREKRVGNYILFVVDASGSMGAGKRMKAVKGAVLSLLSDAYQKRDKVGLVMFKHETAEIVLDMTRSVDLAQKKLEELPTGGKTPLCFGIETAHTAVKTALYKDKEILPVIVLISDGRATYGKSKKAFDDALKSAEAVANDKIHSVVIDAEQDFIKLGLAKKLAQTMNAQYIKLEELKAETLITAVNMSIN